MNNNYYVVFSTDLIVLGSDTKGIITLSKGYTNFDKIHKLVEKNLNNINDRIFEEVRLLSDIKYYLTCWSGGLITLDENGILYFKDIKIPSSLTNKLIQLAENGDEGLSAWFNFVTKLAETSHEDTYNRLHEFLKHNNITINAQGNVLAWKVVTSDYKDCYTRTLDNSVGNIVSMPRVAVEHNVDKTCSTGLHACSFSYVQHFGGSDSILVLVEIDIRNIISVPTDYNGAKVRCCEYKVIHSFGSKFDIQDKTAEDLLLEYEKSQQKILEDSWIIEGL